MARSLCPLSRYLDWCLVCIFLNGLSCFAPAHHCLCFHPIESFYTRNWPLIQEAERHAASQLTITTMAAMRSSTCCRRLAFFAATTFLFFVLAIFAYLYRPYSYGQTIELPPTASDHSGVGVYALLPDRLSKVFPPLNPSSQKYHEWNAHTSVELTTCMALGNCGPNQKKVALLAAHWFEEAVVRGWTGGEGIW